MHTCTHTCATSPMFYCNVHLHVYYISVCVMNAVSKEFCCLAVTEVYLRSMAGTGEIIPVGTSHKCSVSLVVIVLREEWTRLPLPLLTSRTLRCSHLPNVDWFHKAGADCLLLTEWLFLWPPGLCKLPAICICLEVTVICFSSSILIIFGFSSLWLVGKSFYFRKNNRTS